MYFKIIFVDFYLCFFYSNNENMKIFHAILVVCLFWHSEAQRIPLSVTQSLANLTLDGIFQSFIGVFQDNFASLRRFNRNNNANNWGATLNFLSRAVDWVSGDIKGKFY